MGIYQVYLRLAARRISGESESRLHPSTQRSLCRWHRLLVKWKPVTSSMLQAGGSMIKSDDSGLFGMMLPQLHMHVLFRIWWP